MTRAPRSERQTGWHHVMNRGIDRGDIFHSDVDRLDFGRLVGAAAERYEIDVLAYCLMTNHYHLVLSCPAGGLSAFMQDVSAKFTRHANQRLGGDGPIFRSRFASREILNEPYLANAIRYVHRNPLAFSDVGSLSAYRWSSHRTYLGLRPKPNWLSLQPVLGWFASTEAFDDFVTDGWTRDETARQVTDGHAVERAIQFIVAAEADRLGRAPQGAARTLGYLAMTALPTAVGASLDAWLQPTSGRARKQAIWRAQRTTQSEPIYAEMLDAVFALAIGKFHVVSDTTWNTA